MKSERVMPFFDPSNRHERTIIPGVTVATRESDICTCILCHGEGTLPHTSIADAVGTA